MRTFTIVPSFEGESAFFELPDIGFQGDHLSFAILFNLTELTEHWPDIFPSMIVTDPKGNTFIAPHTSWNAESHIFTWAVSSTETTYEGVVKCQLKCTSGDDPNYIVCMSRICQTRVYQSLEAAEDPPEAFQSWLDTLVQLGAEVSEDANAIIDSVEATETNARAAQAAADSAEMSKNAVNATRLSVENTAAIAVSAQEAASRAQQQAQNYADTAMSAKDAAVAAKNAAEDALEEVDQDLAEVKAAKTTAVDAATQASGSMSLANTYRNEALAAKESAVAADSDARAAQALAEAAETGAQNARDAAISAKSAAETAQGRAETAQTAAETAQGKAEAAQTAAETSQLLAADAKNTAESILAQTIEHESDAKKWAVGVDRNGYAVKNTDPAYDNHAKYWAQQAQGHESGAEVFKDAAEAARDTILNMSVSATGLAAGASPTVNYSNGRMTFGIPKGEKGDNGKDGKDGINSFSDVIYTEEEGMLTFRLNVNQNLGSVDATQIMEELTEHIENESIHVSETDRTTWDSKRNYSLQDGTLIVAE